jgi:hypothetical protein
MDRLRKRPARKPRFDLSTRTLSWGGVVVKHFLVPATNQELILAAFEELGWSLWIDDPLPPRDGVDSKCRLHDAINRLNRRQKQPLLHFHGDGTGTRLGWSMRQKATPQIDTRLPPDCH